MKCSHTNCQLKNDTMKQQSVRRVSVNVCCLLLLVGLYSSCRSTCIGSRNKLYRNFDHLSRYTKIFNEPGNLAFTVPSHYIWFLELVLNIEMSDAWRRPNKNNRMMRCRNTAYISVLMSFWLFLTGLRREFNSNKLPSQWISFPLEWFISVLASLLCHNSVLKQIKIKEPDNWCHRVCWHNAFL